MFYRKEDDSIVIENGKYHFKRCRSPKGHWSFWRYRYKEPVEEIHDNAIASLLYDLFEMYDFLKDQIK